MGTIRDPGNSFISHGFLRTGMTERQKQVDVKSRGGQAAKDARDKPRASETFDWDKAIRLNRKTRREVYGS